MGNILAAGTQAMETQIVETQVMDSQAAESVDALVNSIDTRQKSNDDSSWSPEFEQEALAQWSNLYNSAMSYTRNPDRAMGLVQDTYVKAFRFSDKYKEGTSVKGWMLTILRNTYKNDCRRLSRQPTMVSFQSGDYAMDMISKLSMHFYDQIGRQKISLDALDLDSFGDDVAGILSEVPKEKRVFAEAIDDHYLGGMTYAQISEARDIPIGTVMSRLNRGRKLLREALDAQYGN